VPNCTRNICDWYGPGITGCCGAQTVSELEEVNCPYQSLNSEESPRTVNILMGREQMAISVGTRVKVINNVGGHNYPIGTIGTVAQMSGATSCSIRRDDTGAVGNWALITDIEEYFESRQMQAASLKKKIDALEKELTDFKKQHARLTEFEDDEEEVAANVAKILQVAGSTEATKEAIQAVLKGMNIKIKFN
jgi:hypothetical protein